MFKKLSACILLVTLLVSCAPFNIDVNCYRCKAGPITGSAYTYDANGKRVKVP